MRVWLAALMVCALASSADASSISIRVGDNDGYGLGIVDGGTLPWLAPIQDARSAAEKAATDGAQFTDVYSAFYGGQEDDCDGTVGDGLSAPCSPNGSGGTVFFPFAGQLSSATLTIDMADLQAVYRPGTILDGVDYSGLPLLGAMTVDINGVPLSFAFGDGYQQSVVRMFLLTPAMIEAANAIGEVRLTFNHASSADYVAFDYFQLDAEPVPEPATLVLVGTGLAAVIRRRRAGPLNLR